MEEGEEDEEGKKGERRRGKEKAKGRRKGEMMRDFSRVIFSLLPLTPREESLGKKQYIC